MTEAMGNYSHTSRHRNVLRALSYVRSCLFRYILKHILVERRYPPILRERRGSRGVRC